ncbi:bifunctional ADP-dependent NAD(P)H-hydrate dehydratase/NAD(P)H-hydrate epimerase [Arcanobacterium bovis]|uniref:Bifunctional NAD(P)H-hydrate repair enzyme n=1 Tax=Arcanobacterium bovis TaxID=2529275 RepID=A0A4Q9V262_9ACTO|nr:bifunctional ADP-dependent NAD(P)H-hydrate dehydratase/NAD(P)H-hydrate epimerase [Arcanobacterium bovis]TBW22221.1 bifunctional ADP-dependent NAD(P)H-hydrate dehydratase/NAD(P)H-hydrate epimerase [Arcanobacterium bovis]
MEYAFDVQAVRTAEQELLNDSVPLMEQAAFALAQCTIRAIKARGFRLPGSSVLLLVGAGNNGGDALYAGVTLAGRGLKVTAVVGDRAHDDGVAAAQRAGVRIVRNPDETAMRKLARANGTWIDGILGIGTVGAVRDPYASWIRILSEEAGISPAKPLVVAVDVPSGVNADSGESPQCVLPADLVVTMGCLKPGLLEPPAAFLAGEVETISLGFESKLFGAHCEPARLRAVGDADVRDHWFVPVSSDHKYTRGVLGVFTGSVEYPGAALLSVGGARTLGLGMIRYLGEVRSVVPRYPEVVTVAGRVQALLLGSGVTQLDGVRELLDQVPAQLPLVVDAGGIDVLHSGTLSDDSQQHPTIITPHAGELAQLLTKAGEEVTRAQVEAKPRHFAQLAAGKFGVCVVLKGAITLVVTPDGDCFAQSGAPAWTGTAGAGDVLAGVIAGVVTMFQAQREKEYDDAAARCVLSHEDLALAAAIGVHLHLRAAQRAARTGTGGVGRGMGSGNEGSKYPPFWRGDARFVARRELHDERRLGIPITASDIIDSLPDVLDEILNYGR